MTEMNRAESVASEAVVLVGVLLPDRPLERDPLEELEGLARTAGARVVGQLTAAARSAGRDHLPRQRQGRGAASRSSQADDADVVIFDNDLSPAQTRNLEKAARRQGARSHRADPRHLRHAAPRRTRPAWPSSWRSSQYSLPRLKRMWTHLSRIKTGIGMRGPGEKQLEVDRRLVEKRIHDLQTELQAIERRKERQVAARRDRMTVSLVGYTNAGKSTLMNALTGADVLAEDKLFATLDTRTRRWQLPGWGPVLLSDTVGFIRDLPHHLIASFKATLEEARQADLLLHVADASNPAVFEQIAAVYGVLRRAGHRREGHAPGAQQGRRPGGSRRAGQSAWTAIPTPSRSAPASGAGLRELAAAVSDALSRTFLDVDVETGVGNGRLLAYLAAHGEVLSKHFTDSRVTVHCRIPQHCLGVIQEEDTQVRPHRNGHAW